MSDNRIAELRRAGVVQTGEDDPSEGRRARSPL
jgi:hypothetical protein